MTPSDAAHFSQLPQADEAIRLRRWDDLAKVAGTDTADISHWQAPILRLLTERGAGAVVGYERHA